jgi:hypothetical protein
MNARYKQEVAEGKAVLAYFNTPSLTVTCPIAHLSEELNERFWRNFISKTVLKRYVWATWV